MSRKAVFPDDIEKLMALGEKKLSPEDYGEFRNLLLGINRHLKDLTQRRATDKIIRDREKEAISHQEESLRKLKHKMGAMRSALWDMLRAIDELDILDEDYDDLYTGDDTL